MEGAQKKQGQQRRRQNTEVRQKTEPDETEYNPSSDFFLRCMERQIRCVLEDSEARLSESRSEGRVTLEIKEESLANVLYRLQDYRDDTFQWSHEKEQLQKEICSLTAQLGEAQAQLQSSQTEMETLTSRLINISTDVQNDLELLDLQKRENSNLMAALREADQEMEIERLYWQDKSSQFAELEDALKNAKAQLESDSLQWQAEKTSLLEETEKSTASYTIQLYEQTQENNNLLAALKKAEEQLEGHRIQWQEDKSSLLQAKEALQQTLEKKEREWEEAESAMRSQLEHLESLATKKKRNRKWYQKLFSRSAPRNLGT